MSPIGSTFCLLAAGSVDGDDPVDMLSEMDVNVDCNFRAIGLAELVNAKTPREQQSIMITSAACRNDGRWRLIVKEQINKWQSGRLTTEPTAETDCADGWKDVPQREWTMVSPKISAPVVVDLRYI